MQRLLSLVLPIAIIFSLVGCQHSETEYLRKDLRKTVYLLDGSDQIDPDAESRYEVRIDGVWYDADENGNLTEIGKKQQQIVETGASSDDGGGGGGGGGGC